MEHSGSIVVKAKGGGEGSDEKEDIANGRGEERKMVAL